jgi:CRISPR-associated protein Cas1
VDGISVFGMPQLSTKLIRECISANIPIGFYSDDGHYFGSINSSEHINPMRQKLQIYLSDSNEFCIQWSRNIIAAKIENCITLLRSCPQIYEFNAEELRGLTHSLANLRYGESIDQFLGFEGNAAKCYFDCLPKLLLNTDFSFKGRSSRPPKDPFNSMLSYGYSLFFRNIIGAIERHGLHPYFAYLHKLKLGHASLVSDLIEEYRAPLIDNTVLALVNSGSVEVSGFYTNDAGAVFMTKGVAKTLTDHFSEIIAKNERYFYDSGDRRFYGFQAMLDKKVLSLIDAIETRDANRYQPYYWRLDDSDRN